MNTTKFFEFRSPCLILSHVIYAWRGERTPVLILVGTQLAKSAPTTCMEMGINVTCAVLRLNGFGIASCDDFLFVNFNSVRTVRVMDEYKQCTNNVSDCIQAGSSRKYYCITPIA